MSKLQWAAVAGVLGLGIISQLFIPESEQMPEHDREVAAVQEERTVVLAVSGMT